LALFVVGVLAAAAAAAAVVSSRELSPVAGEVCEPSSIFFCVCRGQVEEEDKNSAQMPCNKVLHTTSTNLASQNENPMVSGGIQILLQGQTAASRRNFQELVYWPPQMICC